MISSKRLSQYQTLLRLQHQYRTFAQISMLKQAMPCHQLMRANLQASIQMQLASQPARFFSGGKPGIAEFQNIGDTGLVLGPCPLTEADVKAMQQAGVTAVVSAVTDQDMEKLGLDWPKMLELYKTYGITVTRSPVDGRDEDVFAAKLA